MIDTTKHSEDEDPVRRVLKSAPRIQAPEDFEMRLKRRIEEAKAPPLAGEGTSWWETIFAPRRMPAYALSGIAVVAAGFIAYYALIRTGAAPVEQPPVPEQRKVEGGVEAPPPSAGPVTTPSPDADVLEKPGGRDRRSTSPAVQHEPREARPASLGTKPSVSAPSDEGVSRQPAREEFFKRGALKEVGQGNYRSDTRDVRQQPHGAFELKVDSSALEDSTKLDSLKRLQEQEAR